VEALESRELPSTSHVLQVRQGDPTAQLQTIQAAVDAARPGDEIEIFSGTYTEAVSVSKSDLTLEAAPGAKVVIQNPGGAMNGVTVAGKNGHPLAGFTLEDVTVRGFAGNGVFLSGVTGFILDNITAQGNGAYGLFPVLSVNGRISHCTATGSNDTGIYVGESRNVVIQSNVAHGNTNGIEIENSVGVRAVHNDVSKNTVGILVDLLPGFPRSHEVSRNNVIKNNTVTANNLPNSAPPDDIASVEPAGIGIALVGGDHTQVLNNDVTGNAYAGIAVLSGNDVLALAQAAAIAIPPYPRGIDPNPDHTLVENNGVTGNGFFSGVLPAGFPQPADLIWTGTGTGNDWDRNTFNTSTPAQLP
jgi:parallel beta-helix repeat protein